MIGTTCVRVLDLCLVTCYYFTLAFAISAGTDYLLGDFDPIVKSSKRTAWILASVLLHLNALVVLAAVLRAVVTSIFFQWTAPSATRIQSCESFMAASSSASPSSFSSETCTPESGFCTIGWWTTSSASSAI